MNRTAQLISAAIALVALGAIIWRTDIDAVTAAMAQGQILAMVPWVVALAFGYLALHVHWDRRLLSRTPVPPRFMELWAGKAAAAVLNSIGHALGSGAYAAWIARATGIGIAGATALVLVGMLSDLAALILVALSAMLVGGANVPKVLVSVAAISLGAIAVAILVLRIPVVQSRAASIVRLRKFVTTASAVSLAVWVRQILGRTLNIGMVITGMSLAAAAFGLKIPVAAMCALAPVALLVQVLPVNIAGFGAAQAAFVVLFSPYESEARLLAFHLLWQLTLNVAFVVRGLPFMKRATLAIATQNRGVNSTQALGAEHRD